MFGDKPWTLREKLVHWDKGYKFCRIPSAYESNAVTFLDNITTSSTSRHVHYRKTFKKYVDEDYQEYLKRMHERRIIHLANLGAQYEQILKRKQYQDKAEERKSLFAKYPGFDNLTQTDIIRMYMPQPVLFSKRTTWKTSKN